MRPWMGDCCPFCGEEDHLEYDRFESEGTEAWQRARCEDCGREWNEVYKLTYAEETGDDHGATERSVWLGAAVGALQQAEGEAK